MATVEEERRKIGMLPAMWHIIDENHVKIELWGQKDTTYAMQVPGGVIVRHERVDTAENQPTTSSSSMCFVPMVSLQVEEERAFFKSTMNEITADMGKSIRKEINKLG